ncbi:MAG TPA: mucoidy inhibitor MuiA family protein [candidate division WOR-3 bacterium]|uniref:Mucoidy inhibitor MuiA family protein n=1 Tax=candidate division WOR-3 bacterium TaxID=2052148 RepID=A0A7V0T3U2_UNCW3|nr:mucoidy inhibitor MuiA family protein [candidate division WOR-3 bacterium]
MTALLVALALGASSTIDSVVVYPNQVVVVRSAQVSLSGSGTLEFAGLPGALDDNSVRVRCPGARIGEVQVRRGYEAEPTPAVRQLKEEVEKLDLALKTLDNEAEVLKAQTEFLGSIKLGAPELIGKELQQGRVSSEAWRNALSFMAAELSRVKRRQLALESERKEVEEKLKAARAEYEATRAAVENRKTLRFDYSANAGNYRVEFSYAVPNAASWSPWYELRARPDRDAVELAYHARLSQRTGEDWNRVRVVLSTSTPRFGLVAPEPQAWQVSLLEPESYVRRAKAMPEGIMMAPGAAYDAGEIMDEVFVEPVETGISLQYAIPGRVSLASGEPARKLELARSTLPAEFGHYALPRSREQAFLQGRMVNSTGLVYLAGPASTFVGDEFTGSTRLSAIAPQESTEVSFGIDERVKVSRELVRTFKSRSGLLGRTEKARFAYRITAENYHSKPATVRLVEQVPVSRQQEVKVKVTRVEPAALTVDADQGLYTWEPTLSDGEKRRFEVEFEVEYPTGRRVQGLF